MPDPQDLIIRDPGICAGQPTLKGTRIPLRVVLAFLAKGEAFGTILVEFPGHTEAHLGACIAFAAASAVEGLLAPPPGPRPASAAWNSSFTKISRGAPRSGSRLWDTTSMRSWMRDSVAQAIPRPGMPRNRRTGSSSRRIWIFPTRDDSRRAPTMVFCLRAWRMSTTADRRIPGGLVGGRPGRSLGRGLHCRHFPQGQGDASGRVCGAAGRGLSLASRMQGNGCRCVRCGHRKNVVVTWAPMPPHRCWPSARRPTPSPA